MVFKKRPLFVARWLIRGSLRYDQHISTHLGFLEAGLQALVQPLLGAGLSHRPGIRFIPITDPSILREIGMVVRRNARLPDPVVAFQNHVVENVPRLYEQAISGR